MKEKRKDFPQEQRINQLSTAEFGKTKVRHKFGTVCRIMPRQSDIDSHAAPLMCQTYINFCYYIKLAMHIVIKKLTYLFWILFRNPARMRHSLASTHESTLLETGFNYKRLIG